MRQSALISVIVLAFSMVISAGPFDPNLGTSIDNYLVQKHSPIAGNGPVFFDSGVTHNVDPRLIVAISGAESSFGTVWAACRPEGFNAWSWFYNGDCPSSPFSSFAEGIQTVTKFIRKSYLNKGFTTIEKIGSKYCASGCGGWVPNVASSYSGQGGDVADLTFSRGLVDFETFSGPGVFSGIKPPITVAGLTVSGGQVLSGATNLPVDRSNVYGTASFCSGCLPAITLSFAKPASSFSVFIVNGNTVTVTYKVQDDLGEVKTITLAANFLSGAGTIALNDKNIQSIVISAGTAPGGCCTWDFFIDNVRFTS
ncbi:MAG: hypothetical protein ABL986_07970 [Vicinamibacterales bacterium]